MRTHVGIALLFVKYCICQDYPVDENYSQLENSVESDEEDSNVTFRRKPLTAESIKIDKLSGKVSKAVSRKVRIKPTKTIMESMQKKTKPYKISTKIGKTNDQPTNTDGSTEAVAEFTKIATELSKETHECTGKTEQNDCAGKQYVEESNEDRRRREPLVNYPFAVSLQKMGSHYATGALINENWVLSVAGEFYNVRESIKIYRARLGSVDCKRGGSVVPLKRIEIHPSYKLGTSSFDLALLRLALSVDLTEHIRPIPLNKKEGKVLSAKFLTTYWPRVVVNGNVLPSSAKERVKHNSMRVSTQRLVPWDLCSQIMSQQEELLSESSLCLKPIIAHHSVCLPDVGAPVVANDGLWGITSGWVGRNCTSHASPVVVTAVSAPDVRTWLDSILLGVG